MSKEIIQSEQPLAAYVIGMVGIAFGVIGIIKGIDLYFALKVNEINPTAFSFTMKFYGVSSSENLGYFIALVMAIIGIASLIISIGFLRGNRLAWKALVILSILIIFGDALATLDTEWIYFPSYLIEAGIYGLILYYLWKPHVKSYFW